MIKKFFDKIVKNKYLFLTLVFSLILYLGYNIKNLELDASAETLLLNDDKDLIYSREINKKYNNEDFLILTYSPKDKSLLDPIILNDIKNLSNKLKSLDSISSITSILNVPLLKSPIIPLGDLVNGVPTLENNTNIDKVLVKQEFLTSELYKNSLVSEDFKTTSILLYLKKDNKYFDLINNRNNLLNSIKLNKLSKNNDTLNKLKKDLEEAEFKLKEHRNYIKKYESSQIEEIRNIIKNNKEANIFLGGVSMIANDVINFIKNDLKTYGLGLFLILSITIYILFKSIRWVLIPLGISFISVIATSGILGLFNLEVTVISSNFISLQLILTLSLVIHLMIRYRELYQLYKHSSQYKLVINTILSKLNPSTFAILTTIVGFGSLLLSDILPVKNLGIMMSLGIFISLILTFILFPIILLIIGKKEERIINNENSLLINNSINLIKNKTKYIYITSILVLIFSISGSTQLIVENSFINYFKKDTEIFKGMEIIDNSLGGTTPLELIIKFNENKTSEIIVNNEKQDDSDFDDFSEEYNNKNNEEAYWFTQNKIDLIKKIHKYLEERKEIGKISSFESLLRIGNELNNNKELDALTLGLLYTKIPEEYKKVVIDPYINIKDNEVRFSMRIKDSFPNLRRNDLLIELNNDISKIVEKEGSAKLTGLMVLYNNMLQSLFDSQIKTLSVVLLILLIMFYVTFRNIKYAIIGLISNIIPISLIFGIMGWLNIPLDIMTITIAAISIGIGVDDTIHYIHRYEVEYKKDKNSLNSIIRSHKSIGYAMYYTTLIIILGFAILLFSNLIPTIYFSLLTMIVMISMLFSALILLPRLLIDFTK